MKKQNLDQLLDKYKSGECTPDEIAFIESWYLTYKESHTEDLSLAEREKDLDEVWRNLNWVSNKKRVVTWPRIAAAASILLCLSTGGYYLLHKKQNQQQITQNHLPENVEDIAPGGNKATLTLSNGKQIILTGAQKGKIATQGKTSISKTADGQVVYTANVNEDSNSTLAYNTMTTPKGGQYWVILPDGSKVLLNAASSLTYPIAFKGKERKVELTGEAYFEVVHNTSSPFRVIAMGQTVEDIGTHFNINAYNDEQIIRTTLLEGRIKVSTGYQQAVLQPGQQSQINTNSERLNMRVIEHADEEEAMAWKNGLFELKGTSIQQVMCSAARWYDLNVIYEGEKPKLKLSGRISRNVNLSGLINILRYEGLRCKIDGKNVTIFN